MDPKKLQRLQALTAMVPDVCEQVVIGDETWDVHPVGTRDYVRYVVRRFKSVREIFVAPTRAALAIGETGGEAEFISELRLGERAETSVDDRDDADVAFIALSLERPRSTADLLKVESAVREFPDDVFDLFYTAAVRVTYGDDPAPFFVRVRERIQVTGMDLMAMDGPTPPSA